jgi:CubicO group peptidase (beta-lactamase class C family)
VALLGQALAAAATRPYRGLAQTRVLTPLGMTSSGDLPGSALVVSDQAWDLAAFAPAGGLRATAGDLPRDRGRRTEDRTVRTGTRRR